MREADFARLDGARAAPAHRNGGRRVVRRAERACANHPLLVQNARHRMDLCDFQRLLEGHIGHDGGDTAREHGLAGAGRAVQQNVVPAAHCHFQSALRHRLTLDESEVGAVLLFRRERLVAAHGKRRKGRQPAQMVDRLRERFRRICAHAADERSFLGVRRGHDKFGKSLRLCGDEQWQNARHGAQLPSQRQFAEQNSTAAVGSELARRLEDADGDREVEIRALLFEIGGREIDGDFVGRELSAAVFERGTHPLAALLDGGVGQPGQPVVDIRFHLDGYAVQTVERKAHHFR